jgi:hypothetical protein
MAVGGRPLTFWEIWNKKNVRIFCNILTMPTIVFFFCRIKDGIQPWAVAVGSTCPLAVRVNVAVVLLLDLSGLVYNSI